MKECSCHGIQELSRGAGDCSLQLESSYCPGNEEINLLVTQTHQNGQQKWCIQDEIYPHNWELADPFTPSFISFFVYNSYIPEQKWKYE